MSEFVRALNSYRRGALSQADLLAEVDRQLASGPANVVRLMHVLSEEHARESLPGNAHIVIARKLMQWREPARPDEGGVAILEDRQVGPALEPMGPGLDSAVAVTIYDEPLLGAETLAPRVLSPIAAGTILQGRFKLIEEVGQGGMSSVYKAIDLRKVEAHAQDPYVAVKILTLPLAGFTRSLALLQGEAHKLQSLPHPHIVRVIDCDRDGSTVFMTMECLTGQSLAPLIAAARDPAGPAGNCTYIVECIADALDFAHANGIIHGDLKPGNVILTEKGVVKVIDFGIARLMQHAQSDAGKHPVLDQTGVSAFTPRYASPQLLEHKDSDPRDDIYALACIAHELLTGRHPFNDKTAMDARTVGMKVERHSAMTRGQFQAITRGLEFDRDKRTATAREFIEEFSGRRVNKWMRAGSFTAVVAALVCIALIAYLGGIFSNSPWRQQAARVATPANGTVFRDCPTCPLMKALPSGNFLQGAAADDPTASALERPQHPVRIPYPFGIGTYEVTVGEFREFIAATGRTMSGCESYDGQWRTTSGLDWSNVGYSQTAAHPATCVSWRDATDYARWLSGKTGHSYRLPSASEWEYAARAGATASRPWGTQPESSCTFANLADQTAERQFPGWKSQPCSDGYIYSAPVGSFAANAFGLYDTLGNVSEWVADCWHEGYRGAPADGSAWTAAGDCGKHEMRGGSWFTAPANVGVAARNRFVADYRSDSIGFRVVREIAK